MRIWFWPRSSVYVALWRYGLSFDVQRDMDANGSFHGHLWSWSYRHPFTFTCQD